MSSADVTKITFSDSDKLVGAHNYTVWAFHVEQILREKDLWYIVDPTTSGGSGPAGAGAVAQQPSSSAASTSSGATSSVAAHLPGGPQQPTVASPGSTAGPT